MKSTRDMVNVKDLVLDLENPRFYYEKVSGNAPENDNQLADLLFGEQLFPVLKESIVKMGVVDPIWVKKESDGKYLVIEGNLRVACLRSIINDDTTAPEGVSYDSVLANVIDSSTIDLEVKVLKARLQSGKNPQYRMQDEWLESILKNTELSN